ncbi:hypothetical protein AGMMS49587_13740 [Spirochaetia bacterium]|nr:hypothetical protein AGMMS49587_13740 [Spirochaetia bacterium]
MSRLMPVILGAASLAASALLLVLGFASLPAHASSGAAGGSASAYAVLTVDESAPDREITEALSIIARGPVYSESSQWVFLDDFGELRQIPLDEYDQRLEPFDPRNDGYAERVRSFFVRDGKRFFFIPRNRNFEKRIDAVLGDIQPGLAWSLDSRARPRPLGLYLGLFAAAAVTGLFWLKPRLLGAALFPVLGGLCLFGAPGFALAAVLSLLPALLAEPVRELCYVLSAEGCRFRWGESRSRLLQNSFAPHFFRWILFPLLLALYGLMAAAARFPPVIAVLTFLLFMLIFFFFFIVETKRARAGDHIRFVPLLIAGLPLKRVNFPRVLLPFALSACLALIFAGGEPRLKLSVGKQASVAGSGGEPRLKLSVGKQASAAGSGFLGGVEDNAPVMAPPPLISAAEYRAHAEYQRRFSLLPLGRHGFDEASYFHYDIDDHGLIAKAGSPLAFLDGGLREIPPFPLEPVMEFLGKPGSVGNMRDLDLFELIPVLLVLLLSIPALGGGRGKGKKKGSAIYNDKTKRIAA